MSPTAAPADIGVTAARNVDTQQSRDEEQNDLNHHTSHQHLDQSVCEGNPLAHPDQRVPKRVAVGVVMEVVAEQGGAGNVEDKRREIEEGGDELEGVVEEADGDDGEDADEEREHGL